MPALRHTGTLPQDVRRADLLPIEQGVPQPPECRRGKVLLTLLAMRPGDSFLIGGTSLSNVYKTAQKLRITIRIKRLAGGMRTKDSSYRVWRAS